MADNSETESRGTYWNGYEGPTENEGNRREREEKRGGRIEDQKWEKKKEGKRKSETTD